MTLLMPRIAAEVFNTPLMISETKAIAFLIGLGARLVDGGVTFNPGALALDAGTNGEVLGGRLGDRLGRSYQRAGLLPFDMVQNVAIIPIEGTLVHKGSFIGQSSGQTSYQGLQAQIAAARSDPNVKAVAFEVDSCGGMVSGGFETADMIARLSAEKPTMAILTDNAFSCGYLLASACRSIVMPELGGCANIGAMIIHADFSQKLENEGVKVTIIGSGAAKGEGHPALPMSDGLRAKLQARVDETRDLFAGRVGKYRSGRISKAQALETEAEPIFGAAALKAGLVDAIAPANDAFAAFTKAVNKAA